MSAPTITDRAFDVSAERLFAILTEPITYPEWLVGAKHIRSVSADWPAPGGHFRHVVGFGPLAIPDRTTVRDIEAPHLLVLFVRARPVIEAMVRFDVTSKGGGCALRMTETPVGVFALIAPLAGPLIRARNKRSLDRLAGLVDASGSP